MSNKGIKISKIIGYLVFGLSVPGIYACSENMRKLVAKMRNDLGDKDRAGEGWRSDYRWEWKFRKYMKNINRTNN